MALPSGLSEIVTDEEFISRFARSRSVFKGDPKRAKGKLFVPPRGSKHLSVSRTSGMEEKVIREIGEAVVSRADQDLRGWCNVNVGKIRKIKTKTLDVVSDESDNNHFHAHIQEMPIPSPEDKSFLMAVCNEIAEIAEDFLVITD